MARTALPGRLSWRLARVVELIEETPRCTSLLLELPAWPGHRAGQHVDVRLTAEDGYQAQRSYSIASAPEDELLMLTVERLDDGEVSPYLADELRVGDELELRGPIGGHFVWERSLGGPLLMLAGGSGVVPFRAMARHWAAGAGTEASAAVRLVYSARSLDHVIYREEFPELAEVDVRIALTRAWPENWSGLRGRLDRERLEALSYPPQRSPLVYICGPNGFVEAAAQAMVDNGHRPERIRTERFGPTGA